MIARPGHPCVYVSEGDITAARKAKGSQKYCGASGFVGARTPKLVVGKMQVWHITFKGTKKMERHRMDITQDIQALTTFRNNSAALLQQLKKSKRPLILTVNGKAAAVVQEAEAYQHLLDIAAQADASEGIRQGREDVAKGRVYPARDALKAFRRKHGISG